MKPSPGCGWVNLGRDLLPWKPSHIQHTLLQITKTMGKIVIMVSELARCWHSRSGAPFVGEGTEPGMPNCLRFLECHCSDDYLQASFFLLPSVCMTPPKMQSMGVVSFDFSSSLQKIIEVVSALTRSQPPSLS